MTLLQKLQFYAHLALTTKYRGIIQWAFVLLIYNIFSIHHFNYTLCESIDDFDDYYEYLAFRGISIVLFVSIAIIFPLYCHRFPVDFSDMSSNVEGIGSCENLFNLPESVGRTLTEPAIKELCDSATQTIHQDLLIDRFELNTKNQLLIDGRIPEGGPYYLNSDMVLIQNRALLEPIMSFKQECNRLGLSNPNDLFKLAEIIANQDVYIAHIEGYNHALFDFIAERGATGRLTPEDIQAFEDIMAEFRLSSDS